MASETLTEYVNRWAAERADKVWLRDLSGDSTTEYSWSQGKRQIDAVASELERRFGNGGNMLLLSNNRAHWVLADLAIISSGNVTVPLFTTHSPSTTQYISEFTDARVLILGDSPNWPTIKDSLPAGTVIVTLPGVEWPAADLTWDELLQAGDGSAPAFKQSADQTISLVFTSGTTGVPKGVIQTHSSNVIPIQRAYEFIEVVPEPRFFSYLPLSHLAERQIVEYASVCQCGEVTFNESLETLTRDMARAKPHVMFGAPRVWEQLQAGVLQKFGGKEAFDAMFAADPVGIGTATLTALGLDETSFCLTASAPTPPALIEWWRSLGLMMVEAFGQTEAMSLFMSRSDINRIGSIGVPIGDVEFKIAEDDELLVRCSGLTPGYYRNPEKTAKLFQDGWLHTGDKARVDEDGFVYITGRVKDYFKTIQGKFVAPPPMEGRFAENPFVEQQCLIGRGFAKTVMIAVLSEVGSTAERTAVEESIRETVSAINGDVEKHARIGAVILSTEPWTIENDVLTPTLKIRRDQIDARFAEQARELATAAAESRGLLIEWT